MYSHTESPPAAGWVLREHTAKRRRYAGIFPPGPPDRCRVLPGELPVRGLPGAKRGTRAAGRALDRGASPATACPAREDGPGSSCRRGRGCVTAGGRAGDGGGVKARRQRPVPCAPTLRQRAKLPPNSGEIPRHPAAYGAALPDRPARLRGAARACCMDLGGPGGPARRRRALEAVGKVVTEPLGTLGTSRHLLAQG